MKKLLTLIFLTTAPLLAVNVERDCTKLADEVMVEELHGIVFWSDWKDVRKQPVDDLDCVIADDVLLLQRHPEFLMKLFHEYVGKPLTQRVIWNLKNEIADFYRAKKPAFCCDQYPKTGIDEMYSTSRR